MAPEDLGVRQLRRARQVGGATTTHSDKRAAWLTLATSVTSEVAGLVVRAPVRKVSSGQLGLSVGTDVLKNVARLLTRGNLIWEPTVAAAAAAAANASKSTIHRA